MSTVLTYLIVYICLFVIGMKIYYWGKEQQKKHAPKWSWRLTLFFFFAPVLIFFIEWCFPLPRELVNLFKSMITFMDDSIAWLDEVIEPIFGSFYVFLKPAVAAFFYAGLGFVIGSFIDGWEKNNDKGKKKRTTKSKSKVHNKRKNVGKNVKTRNKRKY